MGDADFHLLLDGVDGWMDDSLKVPSAVGESLFTLFASLTLCLSLSDDANKIKTLNIERA